MPSRYLSRPRLLVSWQNEIIRRRLRRRRRSRQLVSDNSPFFHGKRNAFCRRNVRSWIARLLVFLRSISSAVRIIPLASKKKIAKTVGLRVPNDRRGKEIVDPIADRPIRRPSLARLLQSFRPSLRRFA